MIVTRGSRGALSRGQSLAEFALIAPILLLLLVIAIDFGRVFFSYIEVSNAAREGAAYAAGNPSDLAGITSHARQEKNAQGQAGEHPLTVTADCADSSGVALAGGCAEAPGGSGIGNSVTVSVVEQFTFLTPLIGGLMNPGDPSQGIPIRASASTAVLSLAATGGGGAGICIVAPAASFTVTIVDRTVTLDASASTPTTGLCALSGYDWDMGDGADPFPPVTGKQTTYTYAADGAYTITLQATNQAGSVTTTQAVNVTTGPAPSPTPSPSPSPAPSPSPSPPPVCNYVPDFTWQTNGGGSPTLTFQGSYSGQPAPSSWSWDFTNNGSTDATGQTASHHYTGSPSHVTARLTIQGPSCSAVSVSYLVIP
jgi:PKD repeat protein